MYHSNPDGGPDAKITMKNILRALAITGTVALLFVPFAVSTPEYSKKETKQCVYCHTAVGKPDLNDAGKYYKAHHTLEGYVEKK
ncbi:MAG: hypothetical protein DMG14_21205 [Acidobacteria bacterium]|nr:MAG: hypothetical protein DMG14_21205 [Acidobacteriota bacterium]